VGVGALEDTLGEPVRAFVDTLAPALVSVAASVGQGDPEQGLDDVRREAFAIAAAFIDADGLHTDEELKAFHSVFVGWFPSLGPMSTPGDLRRSRIIEGKREWLKTPSALFGVLSAADKKQASRHAQRYYELAMAVAHAVCALDSHPSATELQQVDAFRTRLIRAMELDGLSWSKAAGDGVPPPHGDERLREEPDNVPSPRPLGEVMAELDALVGLEAVKSEIHLVADLLTVQKLRKSRGCR
jgi:hypothetical protein